MNQNQVAKKVGVCQSVVSRLLRRYRKKNTITVPNKGGRKKILSQRDRRQIVRHSVANPFSTLGQIKESLQLEVCENTIAAALKDAGYCFYVAKKKPLLSVKNKRARLQFALKYKDKPVSFWKKVIFTDEKKFCQRCDNRRLKVIRKVGAALDANKITSTVKHSNKIMAWGCFSWNGVGNLVEIKGNMDTAHYNQVLEEHLWDEVDRRIPPSARTNIHKFRAALHREWDLIPMERIKKLVESMPRRLEAVINAKGGHTRY